MAKTIVILGASYAGLTVTHKLLKSTLRNRKGEYKIVLVSPTTHHYWNLASVRAIIPGQIPDNKLFAPIQPSLTPHKDTITFLLGTATSLDPDSKTVTITTLEGSIAQQYDILVITTGSRTQGDVPWKPSLQGYEATKNGLHEIQERVRDAKSIVLGGAGPTGVEAAAELGFEYGKGKEVTLITSSSQILLGTPLNVANFAESELRKLHITVIKDTRITSAVPLPSDNSKNNKTELTLSSGAKMVVDLYLPTVGVLPNTEFLPKSLLNENGDVIVDDYLRVKGVEGVWAAGDVVDIQPSQFVYMQKQAAALAKNLDLVINGREPVLYKYDGAPMMAVALGRSRATGRFGGNRLPSLIVWFLKGRTLGVQNLQGLVSGSGA
ncbi:AMID-like mitochondrial oxidoreductase-like protein [Rhexocercosporidium sp. MPI-PUGE-AT-0058]|nr:AMID-like mitochondrial oxidoreductase-like protein [Rhexocercosporidium sp. MPI-PUGE-AT-0058]